MLASEIPFLLACALYECRAPLNPSLILTSHSTPMSFYTWAFFCVCRLSCKFVLLSMSFGFGYLQGPAPLRTCLHYGRERASHHLRQGGGGHAARPRSGLLVKIHHQDVALNNVAGQGCITACLFAVSHLYSCPPAGTSLRVQLEVMHARFFFTPCYIQALCSAILAHGARHPH
jgi:hypothetical protein